MLKKTITFKDLDDNSITEDFYFALSKAEIAEMELRYAGSGGLAGRLEKMTEPPIDGGLIMDTFKDMISRSVGKRHEDNVQFVKNDDVRGRFLQSDAYTEFFMELVTDAEAGLRFVRGIMPKEVQDKLAKGQPLTDVPMPAQEEVQTTVGATSIDTEETPRQKYVRLLSDPSWSPKKSDLMAMDKDLMAQAMQRKILD